MSTPHTYEAPADARAALLLGYGLRTIGVIYADADNHLHTVPAQGPQALKLRNIIDGLQRDALAPQFPQQGVAFVQTIPRRLGWMWWTRDVTPQQERS